MVGTSDEQMIRANDSCSVSTSPRFLYLLQARINVILFCTLHYYIIFFDEIHKKKFFKLLFFLITGCFGSLKEQMYFLLRENK